MHEFIIVIGTLNSVYGFKHVHMLILFSQRRGWGKRKETKKIRLGLLTYPCPNFQLLYYFVHKIYFE